MKNINNAPKKALTFQAYFKGLRLLMDGSVAITFHTNEVTGDQINTLRECMNGFGHLLWKENEFTLEDFPISKAVEDKKMSSSAKLRKILFAYHHKVLKKPGREFDSFYRTWMEKKISEIKEKLPNQC